MTVYSVTAGLQPPALSVASSPVGEFRTHVLSAVAGTINTSVADVQGRLRSGQSLAEIARAAGMSRDSLLSTISAAVTAAGRLAPDLALDEVVQRIADQRRRVDGSDPGGSRSTSRRAGDGDSTTGRLVDLQL